MTLLISSLKLNIDGTYVRASSDYSRMREPPNCLDARNPESDTDLEQIISRVKQTVGEIADSDQSDSSFYLRRGPTGNLENARLEPEDPHRDAVEQKAL